MQKNVNEWMVYFDELAKLNVGLLMKLLFVESIWTNEQHFLSVVHQTNPNRTVHKQ